ncbi:SusC/RagA family TonB-linked outer membrane protein [Neotamlana laminarinivorans]|uniref:TonB-dependent receptor n=1 Tax=Neotamlana laminarinivorans TaxID=2883124 RepID=A0A9X1I3Q5_9FLAO|nr:TonB-dependent receptor [Tamlana laminarinivorans]MCB4799652.1 TonB-dependent receptor [Tamlana laminarinivorans]
MNKIYSLICSMNTRYKSSKKIIKSVAVCSLFVINGYATTETALKTSVNNITDESKQQAQVTGTVLDESGIPLPGVNILVQGTNRGVQTDFDGNFTLQATKGDVLVFSYIGFKTQEVKVGNFPTVNVTMIEDLTGLDEVVVVGFSTQTKEAVVGAITQVKPEDLKIPSSNLTTSFAGRVPGVIAFQSSGEPGQGSDNAQFFIRGATTFGNYSSPLILIDNIELTADDLARISPDDIESFSVFKDATATAIYGARGANGVIAVKTKSGELGKPRVSVRYETTYSQATQNLEIADPITYMRLHMEAVNTRNASPNINLPLPYLQNKIDNTIAGTNPYVYPVTDWQDELLQDFTRNQRLNFSVSGGGKIARYYVSGSVAQDNGILKVDNKANFNNNIDNKVYNLRSNVNIDLTPSTELIVQLNQTVDDYRGPVPTGNQVYNMITRTNPVRFPAYYAPDEAHATREHLLFGNVDTGDGTLASYLNPYAELVRGYRDYSRNVSLLSLQLKQDLSGITEGLRWRILGNITNTSSYNIRRQYNPYYYAISDNNYDRATDTYQLTPLNPDSGTEYLDFVQFPDDRVVSRNIYFETALNYDKTFKEKHTISGLLVGIAREAVDGNADNLQESLPSRNIGVSGRFTYDYDRRYFIEGNFGYNGSERFAEENRFGFFPSVGAAWVVSNEDFWNWDFVSRLKLRGSYGVVGNAQIGDRNDRFFYLSEINFNGTGATFGTFGGDSETGVSIDRYENPYISWERAYKQNYGIEVYLLKDAIQLQAEYFQQKTTDILQTRADIPTFLGLQSTPVANLGEGKSGGFELTLLVNHNFNKDWWLQATANFVKTHSKFTVYEEPDLSATPWLSKLGNPFNQAYGLVAERLFIDEADVANSPEQQFGEVMPGDIKYTDINGDGIVSTLDIVPIGEPTQAEISYGFGFSLGYKNFDISAFFAGLDNVSFFIDSEGLTPFADTDGSGDYLPDAIAENQILQAFADNHWSEENQDIYALWPRLSSYSVQNNNQTSTWWMRDGAFMRLKSVEIGYNFTPDQGDIFGQANVRLYLSGTNLVHWSKFKLWDPELRGNGLNYPLQRTLNIGARVNL